MGVTTYGAGFYRGIPSARQASRPDRVVVAVAEWDKRIADALDSPLGSILIPLAMIMTRCIMVAVQDHHERRKHRKHKPKTK